MADRKISDLTALTTPASGDYLPIVDISEASAANKNKRITIEELLRGAPDGTAGAPGIAFESDPNTGIYSPGADQVAISTGGTGRLFIDASGNIGIGTSPSHKLHISGTGSVSSRTFATDATGDASFFVQNDGNGICGPLIYGSTKTAYGALASNETAFYSNRSTTIMADGGSAVIKFATGGNTERARIDSSGRLLVGTSSATNNLRLNETLGIVSAGSNNYGGLSVTTYAGTSIEGGSIIDLQRSRGTTDGSLTKVIADDRLGVIVFRGSDGAAFSDAALIEGRADGEWNTAGDTTDSPGRLVFSTTADGASSPTERLRITSAGVLQVADAGNIAVGTTTGTKIGTATTQKLGFYNATPVVQPAAVADATDAATVITQLNDLLAKLRTLGIIAT